MLLSTFFSSSGMDDDPTRYLFQFEHFLYIALCALVFWALMRFFVHSSKKHRKIMINILLALMLLLKYGGEIIFVSEWVKYGSAISSFSHPFWDVRTFISFQLCGVNNILLPIAYWFNIKPMKDFVYSTSVIGGLAVLLYPVGILYGEPFVLTFVMLRSLIVHFLLVFIPIFLIASGEYTLRKERWMYSLYGSIAMAAWSMFGNLVIDPGANNMYMMENPFYGGPVPLLNVLPDGYHMIVLVILVFLTFVLVYWFAGLLQRRRDKWFVDNRKALD